MTAFITKRRSFDKVLANIGDIAIMTSKQEHELRRLLLTERLAYVIPRYIKRFNESEARDLAEEFVDKSDHIGAVLRASGMKTNKIPDANIPELFVVFKDIIEEHKKFIDDNFMDLIEKKTKVLHGLLPQ